MALSIHSSLDVFPSLFSKEIYRAIKHPGDITKIALIAKSVLSQEENELEAPQSSSVDLIKKLIWQKTKELPLQRIEEDIEKLKKITPAEESLVIESNSLLENLWIQELGDMFTSIPPHRMNGFIRSLAVYQNENEHSPQGIIACFSKAIARSLVKLPEVIDIPKEILENAVFQTYQCAISETLLLEDPVYLRVDESGIPRERYHRKVIETWITSFNPTDPVTRNPVKLSNIRGDFKALEFVQDRLISFLYPEFEGAKQSQDQHVLIPCDIQFLIAAAQSYKLAEKEYHRVLEETKSNLEAIRSAEEKSKQSMTFILSELAKESELAKTLGSDQLKIFVAIDLVMNNSIEEAFSVVDSIKDSSNKQIVCRVLLDRGFYSEVLSLSLKHKIDCMNYKQYLLCISLGYLSEVVELAKDIHVLRRKDLSLDLIKLGYVAEAIELLDSIDLINVDFERLSAFDFFLVEEDSKSAYEVARKIRSNRVKKIATEKLFKIGLFQEAFAIAKTISSRAEIHEIYHFFLHYGYVNEASEIRQNLPLIDRVKLAILV